MRDMNEFGNTNSGSGAQGGGGTKRHRSLDGIKKKKIFPVQKYNIIQS